MYCVNGQRNGMKYNQTDGFEVGNNGTHRSLW